MEFVYHPYHKEVSDSQLLQDIKDVATQLNKESLSTKEYDANGVFTSSTISRRFGSWNNALAAAGVNARNRFHSREELFRNIEESWIKKGLQPTRRDMDDKHLSNISSGSYLRTFGKWSSALQAFVEYINAGELSTDSNIKTRTSENQGSRDVNLRLRFLVMKRDNFR